MIVVDIILEFHHKIVEAEIININKLRCDNSNTTSDMSTIIPNNISHVNNIISKFFGVLILTKDTYPLIIVIKKEN